MERHFWIEDPSDPETGLPLPPGPMRLFPHQKRILRAAVEKDDDDKFLWTTIIYSAPKKSGKTRIAAGMVAWMASQYGPYAECYVMANDGKQSDDRLLSAIRKAIDFNPTLMWNTTRRNVALPDGSFIEAIPVDPSGESGSNPTCTAFSELWGYGLQHKERFWATMTISPARYGRSLRIVETYAGFEGESQTLQRLYDHGVTMGKRHPDFPDLPVFVNEAAQLFCYWDTVPRMPWQTEAYYAQESRLLPHNEFRRLHRNEWVRSEFAAIPVQWWTSQREALPPLKPGEPILVGADAAVSGACFGLVAVTRHPDPARRNTDIAVRYSRAWKPPRGGKINYSAPDGPEEAVKRLAEKYKVLEVAYDPYQLHRTATDFNQKRICFWNPFGQQQPRLVGDAQLYQMIREGRVAHEDDAELRSHVTNANAKTSITEDTKMRFVQRDDKSPIDLLVALSMASKRCMELRM